MKYLPFDLIARSQLDAAGQPFPLEFGPVAGDMVLRNAARGNVLTAFVAALVEKDDGTQYQHIFTCHRGGAVVIPFDPATKTVAFTSIRRPAVPPDKVDAYLSAWDQCIERKHPRHTEFSKALMPLLGMKTYQFPQGYGEAGETSDDNALRVLKLQAGFDAPMLLLQLEGHVVIDPGNRVSPVPFYIAHVDPATRREDSALPSITWVSEQDYFQLCKAGSVISDFTRCGYSVLKENGIW